MTQIPDPIRELELLQPEFRLELVDGKFLVGGTLAGSRWLLKEILSGWGLESAIAFAPLESWHETIRCAFDIDLSDPSLETWVANHQLHIEEIPPLGSE